MSSRINWSKDGSIAYRYFNDNTKTAAASGTTTIVDSVYDTTDFDLSNHQGWLINFPDTLDISKILMKRYNSSPEDISMWVSADSTDGFDGTWALAIDAVASTNYEYQTYLFSAPVSGTWLKVECVDNTTYCLHVFGEYQNQRFEIWDASGIAELNLADYAFDNFQIPNSINFTDRVRFRIRNTTEYLHTYTVTINALKYGGDEIISNYFTLSIDEGVTKTGSVEVSSEANSLSEDVIDIWVDLDSINNPGDGYHFYAIEIVETS